MYNKPNIPIDFLKWPGWKKLFFSAGLLSNPLLLSNKSLEKLDQKGITYFKIEPFYPKLSSSTTKKTSMKNNFWKHFLEKVRFHIHSESLVAITTDFKRLPSVKNTSKRKRSVVSSRKFFKPFVLFLVVSSYQFFATKKVCSLKNKLAKMHSIHSFVIHS